MLANDVLVPVLNVAMLQFRTLAEKTEEQPLTESSFEVPPVEMELVAEQIRSQVREEVLHETRIEVEKKELEVRSRIVQALEAFAQERKSYFERLEQQVVRLSLSIAEKVLQREASIDPLMLAGAVRVALDNVADRSPVVMRVALSEENIWRSHLGKEAGQVELCGDESLQYGNCILETQVGTVDLSVRAQLAEIESNFFDLLGRRPVSGT